MGGVRCYNAMERIKVLHTEPDDDGPYEEFEGGGVEVETASTVEDASELLDSESFDVVVTEIELEDGNGAELVREVRRREPDTGCVLYSDADVARTLEAGAEVFSEFVPRDTENSARRLEQILRSTASNRSQAAYPLVDGETTRAEYVESLDTGSEELGRALDNVVELATEHYDVPMATVSVIETTTQRFVAAKGLDVDEVPRQETICNYTIASDGVTVLEDVVNHPWCQGVDAVHDLDLGFYAGCPVKPEGRPPAGTVCVYDREPREFTAEDERYLSLLARDARSKLENHAAGRTTGGEDGS